MLLAVDIGNSSVTLGLFSEDGALRFRCAAETVRGKSADEYAVLFRSLFLLRDADPKCVTESILSSVVPPVTHAVSRAIEILTGILPLRVGPGIKTGLRIRIDTQTQLGSDLVADAVAASAAFPAPMVIVNLGTATTFTVIDRDGILDGVIIAPGVRVSMNALAEYGAELPDISVAPPKRMIGKNTGESMQAGVLFGHAAMLDGMVKRIEKELGEPSLTVAVTGGLAETVLPYCETKCVHCPDLTLRGLYLIAGKNKR